MEGITETAAFLSPIHLGMSAVMCLVLTVAAVVMKAKPAKALEGGIKLALALTAMGVLINVLTNSFTPVMQQSAQATGRQLQVIDVGWAPLAAITWGSAYTLVFVLVLVAVNMGMLYWGKTQTLDVDIMNMWHPAIVGLLVLYYSDNNLLLAVMLVAVIGVLKLINADLLKPTFNTLLNMPAANPTTTTHMNYMLNPVIMVFDKLFETVFPYLDTYDFDVSSLNKKIGFWGSKFAIGIYIGILLGVFGRQSLAETLALAFTAGVCLELFSVVGSWFIAAVDPLSQGITNYMTEKLNGRNYNIGIDWPFLSARSEMWTVANLLVPVMLIMAPLLPGAGIIPMGGLIAIGLTPALLVVTGGKIIRMLVIGTFMLPLFLWSGSAIAPFVTAMAQAAGACSSGAPSVFITHSTLEGPVEKFIAILVGQAGNGVINALSALGAVGVYIALFAWYARQMKKRNSDDQPQEKI